MNPLTSFRRLLPLLLGFAMAMARAGESVRSDEGQVRAAVTKSLGFLAKEGDTWMNEKNCNSCHTMPFLLWSHREAKRRGFSIDDTAFKEFVDWSNERSKDTKAGPEVLAFMKLAMPDQSYPELTKLIVGLQQTDGSWRPGPGGQFTSMQRGEVADATANSTRIFLLALATQPADQPLTDAAREKAKALLEKDTSAKTVETLVYRTLYARRFGNPEEVATLCAEILKLQHTDGGWGWMIGEEHSDSLPTGEVLYVLQREARTTAADAIARGRRWLLDQQREDGGWSIDITRFSKLDRSAPAKAKSFKDATGIYTFWGSAWATIGLLEGLPVAEKQ